MGLFAGIWKVFDKANRSGVIQLTGQVNLGATGAVSSSDTPRFSVTKTAAKAGRYDIQLKNPDGTNVTAMQLVDFDCKVWTAAADAAYTAAKGSVAIIRNNLVSTTGAFQLQLIRPDTFADAEAEDNVKLIISMGIKTSSAVP
jgi:hypothetical protein